MFAIGSWVGGSCDGEKCGHDVDDVGGFVNESWGFDVCWPRDDQRG